MKDSASLLDRLSIGYPVLGSPWFLQGHQTRLIQLRTVPIAQKAFTVVERKGFKYSGARASSAGYIDWAIPSTLKSQ